MSSIPASIAPDLGHAVRPDGTLMEASDLTWSYDVDESIPFPSGHGSGMDPISSGGHAPATMVAGARRTTRIHRPSQRALEAAEATSSGSASTHLGSKRKAPSDPVPDRRVPSDLVPDRRVPSDPVPDRRVTRKVVHDVDNDDAEPSDDGATTEPATDLAEDDYESIKSMADADNRVRSQHSSPSLLNDVLTYFSGYNSR
jgi:hypothetical protein